MLKAFNSLFPWREGDLHRPRNSAYMGTSCSHPHGGNRMGESPSAPNFAQKSEWVEDPHLVPNLVLMEWTSGKNVLIDPNTVFLEATGGERIYIDSQPHTMES